MFDKMLSFIAPHLCFGCANIGTILCDRCIQNIIENRQLALEGHLLENSSSFSPWIIASRQGELKKLIDAYKFERAIEARQALARLFDAGLPVLPTNTVVVPVPTIAAHIRNRGYDHCALMARDFARRRRIAYAPLLRRRSSSQQRGASRQQRHTQAAAAFVVHGNVTGNIPYIIIDDITTTGSTLQWAAQALMDAGAITVWTAAVAQQPLDD